MKSFLAVLQKAGVSAWVRDLRADTVLLTPGLCRQLGIQDDGTSKSLTEWQALVHESDLVEHERRIQSHLAGKSDDFHSRVRLRAAGGSWRIVEIRGWVIERNKKGEPLFIGGIVSDITASSPLTSPALFKTVVEAANEGVWMIGLDSLTWYANERMAQMLGTTADEMIGNPPTIFCFPEDVDQARDVILQNFAGIPVEFEFRFRRMDGTEIPVLGGSAPIRDETGEITGSVAMFSDLTARKAAEMALLESERQARIDHVRLAAAQEGAGAGTWEIDLGAGAVLLDEQSLKMHGLPADTPMPMTPEQWMATLDVNTEEAVGALRDCIENGVQFRMEFSTEAGKNWILGMGRAVRTEADNPMKVVGLNLNITETKHAEQQLARMRGEFVHLARMGAMGSMASSIAHELNQPLAATSNYLSAAHIMLQREQHNDAALAITSALETTLKAGDIIRKIRDGVLSRNAVRREVDLREVTVSALQLALLDAPQRGIRVSKNLRRGVSVMIDPVQIEQVIINLVRNAVDAVSEVDSPSISITTTIHQGRAIVQVGDSGKGVPNEMRDTLFETFSTSKDGGMGIGLSICRTIVEAHEGRIWMESTSPKGTTFKFDLPLANISDSVTNGGDQPSSELDHLTQ